MLPLITAGLVLSLLCCPRQSFAQRSLPPVFVEEPSSPELERDKNQLDVLSNRGDFRATLSAADKLATKWRATDKLSYFCILSAVCDDLTARDFGPADFARRQSAAEKYAAEALSDGALMPLTMRAFFAERLTYAPGHGRAGARGKEWSRLRSRRLALWLGTWQQIRQRTVLDFSYNFDRPQLPPRKFISQRVTINGVVDPENITDTVLRLKYLAAVKKYQDDCRLASDQKALQGMMGAFVPATVKNIIIAYSAAPYDTDELARQLSKRQIGPDVSAQILACVKQNI